MTVVYIALATALVLVYAQWQGWRAFTALDAWCRAGEEYDAWRERNPNVYPGMSHTARLLIRQKIRAYDRFVRLHPYCDDGPAYRRYLLDKLDDVSKKEAKRRSR